MRNIKVKVEESLDELIPRYAMNKNELDSYKKLCDTDNAEIKRQMKEAGTKEAEAGGYVVKYSVSTRESLNEDKLIEIIKKHNIDGIIKTKEYIDMDALESYLYSTSVPADVLADFDSCRSVTEVVQLRISRAKKKEED